MYENMVISSQERISSKREEIKNRYLGYMKVLIDRGFDVNDVDENGFSPLYMAILSNQVSVVELLIKCGACVNQDVKNGCSPLLIACARADISVEIMKCLIEYGANIEQALNEAEKIPNAKELVEIRIMEALGYDFSYVPEKQLGFYVRG